MFAKLLLILVFTTTLIAHPTQITHYLLPMQNKQALESILQSIENAQDSIYVMMFSFTHRDISRALKDAAAKGVKVKVIADKSQSKSRFSQIAYLNKYNNIKLYTLKGKRAQRGHMGSMHQKTVIIDKNLTYTGSANYSNSAFTIHYENIIKFNCTDTAQKYREFFYTIKKGATTF